MDADVGIAILLGLLAWLLTGAAVGLLLGRVIDRSNPSDERQPRSTANDQRLGRVVRWGGRSPGRGPRRRGGQVGAGGGERQPPG
jgi:hypothetical protein